VTTGEGISTSTFSTLILVKLFVDEVLSDAVVTVVPDPANPMLLAVVLLPEVDRLVGDDASDFISAADTLTLCVT